MTLEAALPLVRARAAAREVAAVRPTLQLSLRHLASCDVDLALAVDSLSRDIIECQETYAMYFINPLMMSVKLHIINDNVNAYLNYTMVTVGVRRRCR